MWRPAGIQRQSDPCFDATEVRPTLFPRELIFQRMRLKLHSQSTIDHGKIWPGHFPSGLVPFVIPGLISAVPRHNHDPRCERNQPQFPVVNGHDRTPTDSKDETRREVANFRNSFIKSSQLIHLQSMAELLKIACGSLRSWRLRHLETAVASLRIAPQDFDGSLCRKHARSYKIRRDVWTPCSLDVIPISKMLVQWNPVHGRPRVLSLSEESHSALL